MGNWNISGSQCELNSVPTSPTKSVDTSHSERAQRQISSESSVSSSADRSKNKEKSRYLRDRLESIGPNEIGELPTSSSTTFKRVNSFNTSHKPIAVHSTTNFITSDEPSVRFTNNAAEDVEPYAWLSQTAPASPLNGRSRSCSRSRGEDQYLFYLDGDHDESRKSRGSGQFSSLIIGNAVNY